MPPKERTNRFKIRCLECNVEMDFDYKTKHNLKFHKHLLNYADLHIYIYTFIVLLIYYISVVVAVNIRSVRGCCPAESLFQVREIVKYMIYLPPRIEQCMFVGKSMKLHPPTQNGHGTLLIEMTALVS